MGLVGAGVDDKGRLHALQIILLGTEEDQQSSSTSSGTEAYRDRAACGGVRITCLDPAADRINQSKAADGPEKINPAGLPELITNTDATTIAAALREAHLTPIEDLTDQLVERMAPVILWGSEVVRRLPQEDGVGCTLQ